MPGFKSVNVSHTKFSVICLCPIRHTLMIFRFITDGIKKLKLAEELCDNPMICLTILKTNSQQVGKKFFHCKIKSITLILVFVNIFLSQGFQRHVRT